MSIKVLGDVSNKSWEVLEQAMSGRISIYDLAGNPISELALRDTKQTYTWIVPSTPVGANKLYLDMFNNGTLGNVVNILSIRPIMDTDVTVVGILGIRICVYKTSAIGTGGTLWNWRNPTLDIAGGCLTPQDTKNKIINSDITGRHLPTGGATISEWIRGMYAMGEEIATSWTYLFQGQHNICSLDNEVGQPLKLRDNEGILIKQGAVASVGNIRFRITFTIN